MRSPSVNRRARWMVWSATVLAAGLVYAGWPRRVDLRHFDPAALGRMETAMWRQYYERRYASLIATLYDLNRSEYGFSPWDSARLSFYAGRAAAAFQPTASRPEAEAALPYLERYFHLLTRRAGSRATTAQLARLELEWWQQRREGVAPTNYATVIAQVEAALYGLAESEVLPSALLRAEAMAFRDARGRGGLNAEDWVYIQRELTRSYQSLWDATDAKNRRKR
jgi:hypothetical protein